MSIASKLTAVPDVARALPWVVRAKWRIRRTRDLRLLVREHDYSTGPPSRARSIPHIRRGVDGALRIVGPREAHCVPRALALFALLTRTGYGAVFVSGVHTEAGALRGHAWVLVDDRPVERPGSTDPLATYREQLRIASRNGLGA
jgi:hypothetical protein